MSAFSAQLPDAARSAGGPLRLEWRDSAADIAPHLWQRCFPPPLEGLWLQSALEQGCEDGQFDFAYGVVTRGGEEIAIAPVFVTTLPVSLVAPAIVDRALRLGGPLLRPLRFQRALFIGSPCADEGGVGLMPGIGLDEVVPVVQEAAWKRAKAMGCAMMTWKDMPESHWPALRALAQRAGLDEAASYPGTRIADLEGGFAGYLGRLSGRRRHHLRKKLRLSRAAVDIAADVVAAPDAALVDDIWALFHNTYTRATTRFERLTKAFFVAMARHPDSRFIVLRRRDSGRPVAFMLAVLRGDVAINKFLGIDYDQGPESHLYFRLWEEFVRFATAAGAARAQSGQTSYRAKLDLGHELVPLNNFFRYRNPVMHRIAAAVAGRISWTTLDPDLALHLRSRRVRAAMPGGGPP